MGEFFLVKEDRKEVEFNIVSPPKLEFADGCGNIASNFDHKLQDQDHQHQHEDDKKEEEYESSVSSCSELKKPLLGHSDLQVEDDDNGFRIPTSLVDDDDNGFRTPTSLDSKLPVITKCPPAPKKSKPQTSNKRKASSPIVRRSLLLDLSKEVESMFPPKIQQDLGQKIKKARRDNTE
ncbi:unnamed protein product [Ilex paraguariensis]|uniref:Cyclin-dependent protein kinase inhibitor SMR3-like n=1 Tax=Ilex paraguariensis TaxID=185542 RepID=A0ABC8TZ82_9AQUA